MTTAPPLRPAPEALPEPAAAAAAAARPAPPSRRPSRRSRGPAGHAFGVPLAVLALVFLVGLVHAGLYAVLFPPWAVEDEQQHVDYAWKLGHDHRLPQIDEEIDTSIIYAIWGTDRWGSYGQERPSEPTATAMGLGGQSYEAYHPPLPYLVGAPVVAVTGDHARWAMYGLRAVTALLAGFVCVAAALLAGRLAPARASAAAALGAGLAVALLPAVAEAGGRFNTDLFAAAAVLAGVLVLLRWLDDPSPRRAWLVGGVLAAAVLTRETAIVLVVPLIVVGVVASRRGRLHLGDLVRAVAPPATAAIAWTLVLHGTSGHASGADAFVSTYGTQFPHLPAGDLPDLVLTRGLVAYGDWGLPAIVGMTAAVVAMVGLVLAARAGRRVEAVIAVLMLVAQLGLLWWLTGAGLSTVSARLLLPSYPVVVAVAVAGWAQLRWRFAPYVPAAGAALLAVGFLVVDFVPAYGWPFI